MKRSLLIFLFMLFVFFTGIAARRCVFEVQQRGCGTNEIPFTLESALEYRLVRVLYETGTLPAFDSYIEAPAGINRREMYTLGAEYVYAACAHLLPARWSLTYRVRWVALGWFCLGIFAMIYWVRGMSGSWSGGLAAGFFYAVSAAAVVRSTGQELSHENFALPLLLAHLACSLYADRAVGWRRWMSAAASALLLAAAAATWDMIQFYLYLWMFGYLLRAITGNLYASRDDFLRWLLHAAVLLASFYLVPYMVAHAHARSPLVLMGIAIALAGLAYYAGARRFHGRWLCGVLIAGVLLMEWLFVRNGESYRHFAELLWAKIRFLNQKPADPALLTFNQRILWTPALNSATWRLTFALFPATLLLSFLAVSGLFLRPGPCRKSETFRMAFWFGISLLAYVLFVRFHVFTALFSAGLIGCWLGSAMGQKGAYRWVVGILLCMGGAVEAVHLIKHADAWSRSDVEYKDLCELVDWISEKAEGRAVLANFGVSAFVLAYADCPIVLHPKFETEQARSRVAQYGEYLFKHNEKAFRDWADRFDVDYFIYSKGEFSSRSPERQMRYFVNALIPPDDAAARVFEYAPDRARWFRYVWGNRKYSVFDMVTSEEEALSEAQADQAYEALCSGRLEDAESYATEALKIFLYNEKAQQVLLHTASLREQKVNF